MRTHGESDTPESDRPEVFYIPGAQNQYDYEHDVVILDSHLLDYPLAHDLILEHELGHSEAESALGHLRLELEADTRQHFGTDDGVVQAREYLADRHERAASLSLLKVLSYSAVNAIRPLWKGFMAPLGYLYRLLKRGERP